MTQEMVPANNSKAFPDWLPVAVRNYLAHTETGLPIRALARAEDCHASTILRQIRRCESRRDDPLFDAALRRLSQSHLLRSKTKRPSEAPMISIDTSSPQPTLPNTQVLHQEASRILRRLTEAGSVLAVAKDMDKAVVVRDNPDGTTGRTAIVDQETAQAMVLKEWIVTDDPTARIARYRITPQGRSALKLLIAEQENAATGMSEATSDFAHKTATPVDADTGSEFSRQRSFSQESPLISLSRRKDKDGKPFLNRDLVAAGERLREDFEISQIGTRVTQDWDQFLMGGVQTGQAGNGHSEGSSATAARDRVAAALSDLGPGLGDVALHCCCFLEGMEHTEKRMGWSARSGKIVLRIALQRLRLHYDTIGKYAPRIG